MWVFLCNYFLAESDKKKLLQVFEELDEDKDGLLTKEEVQKGRENFWTILTQLKIGFEKYQLINELAEGGVDEIIGRIDRNKNGSIDYSGIFQGRYRELNKN